MGKSKEELEGKSLFDIIQGSRQKLSGETIKR